MALPDDVWVHGIFPFFASSQVVQLACLSRRFAGLVTQFPHVSFQARATVPWRRLARHRLIRVTLNKLRSPMRDLQRLCRAAPPALRCLTLGRVLPRDTFLVKPIWANLLPTLSRVMHTLPALEMLNVRGLLDRPIGTPLVLLSHLSNSMRRVVGDRPPHVWVVPSTQCHHATWTHFGSCFPKFMHVHMRNQIRQYFHVEDQCTTCPGLTCEQCSESPTALAPGMCVSCAANVTTTDSDSDSTFPPSSSGSDDSDENTRIEMEEEEESSSDPDNSD